MRVISGNARGMKLEYPENMLTRPTTDRIKESIFNIIQFDIEGRNVIDLFAGSGQLGIEALSRGAKSAVFVDNSQESIAVINQNLKHTKFTELSKVVCMEATTYLAQLAPQSMGLILMDPPYGGELLKNAVRTVILFDILSNGGIIICESASKDDVGTVTLPYKIKKEYKYGDKKITLIIKEN